MHVGHQRTCQYVGESCKVTPKRGNPIVLSSASMKAQWNDQGSAYVRPLARGIQDVNDGSGRGWPLFGFQPPQPGMAVAACAWRQCGRHSDRWYGLQRRGSCWGTAHKFMHGVCGGGGGGHLYPIAGGGDVRHCLVWGTR